MGLEEGLRPDLDRARSAALLEESVMEPWILVPLGNPGEAYADTRHNLGRLLLQRWMDRHCPRPGVVHRFQTGTLYSLRDPFLALVPGTYMNLSGQTVAEAVEAGFSLSRMVILHDDKDLPLGVGRLKADGGDGGHNGLKSLMSHLGTDAFHRFRAGIGPIQRPLADFVLGPWTEEEWSTIAAMDGAFDQWMACMAEDRPMGVQASLVNAASFWTPADPTPLSP